MPLSPLRYIAKPSVKSRRLSVAESPLKLFWQLLVGARTVYQFVAVAVDSQDVSKRVFHINHAVWLLEVGHFTGWASAFT